jgi:hypothetical protein
MISYFKNFKNIWNKYGFEIILCICILFILVSSLYNKFVNRKGTWNRSNYASFNNYRKLKSQPLSDSEKNDSKGEIETRKVLESIFRQPFNKARPSFLLNPVSGGNHALELDCYNSNLKLAAEYNGEQHYKYIPFFHKNKEAFLNQKYRDDMKYRICKEKGIDLIIIPYTVKIEDIYSYIFDQLRYLGYKM